MVKYKTMDLKLAPKLLIISEP